MTPLEHAARIAREREDLRRILGDKYDAAVEPYRALIREGIAKGGGRVSEIDMALAIGRAGMAAGRPLAVSYATAALCDIIEARPR